MPPDHLSTALSALKEHPQPGLGLETDSKVQPLGYLARLHAESEGRPARPRGARKTRMAFNLPEELCERARNAVWHLSDVVRLNLSSLAERTLEREVTRLEKKYNRGRPFPKRQGRLKGGPLQQPASRPRPSRQSTDCVPG